MRRFRQTRAAEVTALGLALATGALSACGPDDDDKITLTTGEPVDSPEPDVVCQLQQRVGDTNCDGRVDADTDEDGIADPLDRYEGGYDYGDDDRDGYANWIDGEPLDSGATVGTLPDPDAADEADAERLRLLEARLSDQGNHEAVQRMLEIYQEADEAFRQYQEGIDTDYDEIPDYRDVQPDLHRGYDEDGDRWENQDDFYPYDEFRH